MAVRRIRRAPRINLGSLKHLVHDEREHILRGVVAGDEEEDQQTLQLAFADTAGVPGLEQRVQKIRLGIQATARPPVGDELASASSSTSHAFSSCGRKPGIMLKLNPSASREERNPGTMEGDAPSRLHITVMGK